jgi:hypothetical protein
MNERPHEILRETAERFSAMVLGNVVREYPNQLSHVMTGPGDVRSPRALHPVFFGCYDWHSCVHGYWLLARLHRRFGDLSTAGAVEAQFDVAFTEENIAGEIGYLERAASGGFERPYGWAWLLMLCRELSEHKGERGRRWQEVLKPMGEVFANRFLAYLPKADYPVRAGNHGNSAFATILALEFAETQGNGALAGMLKSRARQWYLGDAGCQVWEPSQSDFLSPALVEALCMLRVLPRGEFLEWFDRFLPGLRERKPAVLFSPARVSDPADGQISHLNGLNLSRAWCFSGIADGLEEEDGLAEVLREAAGTHLEVSLPEVFGNYAGEHWLATFAVLAVLG